MHNFLEEIIWKSVLSVPAMNAYIHKPFFNTHMHSYKSFPTKNLWQLRIYRTHRKGNKTQEMKDCYLKENTFRWNFEYSSKSVLMFFKNSEEIRTFPSGL